MEDKKSFSYFTYEVGRYFEDSWVSSESPFKSYKEDKSKLQWYVFVEDINAKEIVPVNLFEYNWVFLESGLLYAKKHYSKNFNKFADHIRRWLSHEYWSRCQYETIITSWPPYIEAEEFKRVNKEITDRIANGGKFYRESINLSISYKMDVYTQVMMNWDRFIEYVWNNKHLITERKLGLKK